MKIDGKGSSSSRRDFIHTGAVAIAATVAGAAGVPVGEVHAGDASGAQIRWTMAIDLDRCTGCKACAVACKAEHNVRLGAHRSWVDEREKGKYPRVRRLFLPRLCNHCDHPPCLKVCPTGATYKRADGIVDIDKDKCIGCRYCVVACPYSARYTNPQYDPDEERDFPARTHGTADKCDFCRHRIDNGAMPSCINTCPAGARIFGDIKDPDSEISRVVASKKVTRLLPEQGTRPFVLYLGGDPSAFTLHRGSETE